MRILILIHALIALAGCVSAAKTIVTAPFKVGGAVVDAATTSQSEADEKRGREMRKAEEREARARHKAAKAERKRAKELEELDAPY